MTLKPLKESRYKEFIQKKKFYLIVFKRTSLYFIVFEYTWTSKCI